MGLFFFLRFFRREGTLGSKKRFGFEESRAHASVLAAVHGRRPFISGRLADQATKGSHAAFDAVSGEPTSRLENAQLNQNASADVRKARRASINRMRLRRQKRAKDAETRD